ncbi:hypothetical protein H8944_18620, partial [Bacillus pumilus]|uniref:hypothetical protein n=1 Tax=Bacillus pumilus TaxID=1408 RepID=UPI00164B3E86
TPVVVRRQRQMCIRDREITAAKLQEEKKQVKTELENNSIPSKYLNAAKEILSLIHISEPTRP